MENRLIKESIKFDLVLREFIHILTIISRVFIHINQRIEHSTTALPMGFSPLLAHLLGENFSDFSPFLHNSLCQLPPRQTGGVDVASFKCLSEVL